MDDKRMSRTKELDRLTDEQLLDTRLCDLPLSIAGTPLDLRVARLYKELTEEMCKKRKVFELSYSSDCRKLDPSDKLALLLDKDPCNNPRAKCVLYDLVPTIDDKGGTLPGRPRRDPSGPDPSPRPGPEPNR